MRSAEPIPNPCPTHADRRRSGGALEMTLALSEVGDRLVEAGIRRTRQRELIYRALLSADSHPTAESLLGAVREDEPGLSLATVYNTLDALSRAGLCRKLPSSSGGAACRFDGQMHPHAHVTLPDGRVMDVPEDLSAALVSHVPPETIAAIERRLGVRIESIAVEMVASGARPSDG